MGGKAGRLEEVYSIPIESVESFENYDVKKGVKASVIFYTLVDGKFEKVKLLVNDYVKKVKNDKGHEFLLVSKDSLFLVGVEKDGSWVVVDKKNAGKYLDPYLYLVGRKTTVPPVYWTERSAKNVSDELNLYLLGKSSNLSKYLMGYKTYRSIFSKDVKSWYNEFYSKLSEEEKLWLKRHNMFYVALYGDVAGAKRLSKVLEEAKKKGCTSLKCFVEVERKLLGSTIERKVISFYEKNPKHQYTKGDMRYRWMKRWAEESIKSFSKLSKKSKVEEKEEIKEEDVVGEEIGGERAGEEEGVEKERETFNSIGQIVGNSNEEVIESYLQQMGLEKDYILSKLSQYRQWDRKEVEGIVYYEFREGDLVIRVEMSGNEPRAILIKKGKKLLHITKGQTTLIDREVLGEEVGEEETISPEEEEPFKDFKKGSYEDIVKGLGYWRKEEDLARKSYLYIPVEYVNENIVENAKKRGKYQVSIGRKKFEVRFAIVNNKEYIVVNMRDAILCAGNCAKQFFSEKGKNVIRKALKGSRNIENSPDFKETIIWKFGRTDWGRSVRSSVKAVSAMGGFVEIDVGVESYRMSFSNGNYYLFRKGKVESEERVSLNEESRITFNIGDRTFSYDLDKENKEKPLSKIVDELREMLLAEEYVVSKKDCRKDDECSFVVNDGKNLYAIVVKKEGDDLMIKVNRLNQFVENEESVNKQRNNKNVKPDYVINLD